MSLGALKALGSTSAIANYAAWLVPSGVNVSSPPGSATSGTVIVKVNGGVPPYTSYSWIKLSGDPITISDDTSDMVTFSAQISNGPFQEAIWRVTVEDTSMATTTADITVTFEFEIEF